MTEHRDRILDWKTELLRLAPELPKLPEAARAAVLATVAQFLREDAEAAVAGLERADDPVVLSHAA